MKKEMKSFLLKMAVVLLGLCAVSALGAYGTGHLCMEMLFTPFFLLLAAAAYRWDTCLHRSRQRRTAALRVVSKEPSPLWVA